MEQGDVFDKHLLTRFRQVVSLGSVVEIFLPKAGDTSVALWRICLPNLA